MFWDVYERAFRMQIFFLHSLPSREDDPSATHWPPWIRGYPPPPPPGHACEGEGVADWRQVQRCFAPAKAGAGLRWRARRGTSR